MNFLTIFNNQIEEQKKQVEIELRKYTLSHINFIPKNNKEHLHELFKKTHNKNLLNYLKNTFLFKNQYNESSFNSLKEQFIFTIINDQKMIIDFYQSQPIEIVLAAYFHYTQKNINQEQLFNFIQVIINNNNPVDFLEKFIFVSDYDMHLFVISFIENNNSTMLLKKQTSNFYEKFINYLKNYKEKKLTVEIFTNIFYSYIDNKMFQSAQLFKDEFSDKICSIRIKNTLDLIKNDDICKDYLSIFSILSSFNNKYYFADHLNLIYESLRYDYFSDHINLKQQKSFKFIQSNEDLLKNNLYSIYKNILFQKIISNQELNITEINLLMQTYCISNTLFSLEEQSIVLVYLKNSLLFNNVISEKNNSVIVFLFFSFYNNFDYFTYIIQNDQDIIKSIITINYQYLNKNVYNILIKYSNFDLISNLFKKFLNKKFLREFLISQKMAEYAKTRHLYYFGNQIFDIDPELFNSLINEDNKVIFEEIYVKKTIANF